MLGESEVYFRLPFYIWVSRGMVSDQGMVEDALGSCYQTQASDGEMRVEG